MACFDEASKELRGDVVEPVPPAPGSPAKQDYEYNRHGTANLFMIVEPPVGRRHATVNDRRTIPEFAARMKHLCDEMYPEAEVIRVVLDVMYTRPRLALHHRTSPRMASARAA